MAEYIEREAAIMAVEQVYHRITVADEDPHAAMGTVKYSENVVFVSDAEKALENLPAAAVRPVVKGRWIPHDDFLGLTLECSVCHVEGMIGGNFCCNCGADNREVKDG